MVCEKDNENFPSEGYESASELLLEISGSPHPIKEEQLLKSRIQIWAKYGCGKCIKKQPIMQAFLKS